MTEKGVTTSTEYRLHGKRVTHLTQKAAGDVAAEELHFYYDAEGRPEMVDWNGTVYTYLHNVQGDVTGIVDNTGSIVVEYKYDAWGYPIGTSGSLTTTLGTLNPFRYRGYMYDEETGLYYLRSRYYNPNWGRFINADALLGKVGGLFSHNLFAYCGNNPVRSEDPLGYDASSIIDKQGWQIFWWYLMGYGARKQMEEFDGKPILIRNDFWGDYMRSNKIIQSKVNNKLWEFARKLDNGEMMVIFEVKGAVNIEDSIKMNGYSFLHSTYNGGMSMSGEIEKDVNGQINYSVTCTWNDRIDANYSYSSDVIFDVILASGFYWMPGACSPYDIQIVWDMKGVLN